MNHKKALTKVDTNLSNKSQPAITEKPRVWKINAIDMIDYKRLAPWAIELFEELVFDKIFDPRQPIDYVTL